MASAPRIAVSNIAWEPTEDDAIVDVLRREGVSAIEIAPTKWRKTPFEARSSEVAEYRRLWEDRGLRVVSLQALLFGRPDLQLFGDTRAQLAEYLKRAVDFAATIDAHALVFGSPRNRIRGALSKSDAMPSAADFLRDIGSYCADRGTILCIEANPVEYGCDFVTTTAEAIALCRDVNSPGVRVNADLGAIAMSHEDVASAIASARDVIGHYHASEPNLAEISGMSPHGDAGRALKSIDYSSWVSIEMRAAGDNVAAVARAISKVKNAYS